MAITGEDGEKGARARFRREAHADARMTADNRRLDFLAFGLITLVITFTWLPTLTSGRRANPNEDFLLHASRHEAVRKSLIEHRTFPLRSHWFGGGFPTLGEPNDPALNPLVLLSVLFGSAMGIKLIAFLAVLVSGLGTYALGRYIIGYTRWGALFSALIVGASLYVPAHMEAGNLPEVCLAYLPLCMLLIALSCRGRRRALFLLPLVLYTVLSGGKQGFFTAMLYLAVLCVLGALPMLNAFAPEAAGRKLDVRALTVLLLALGVTFFVGMARILPALEFISAKGGLTHMELVLHEGAQADAGPTCVELLQVACGFHGRPDIVTVGWLPVVLFGIACCFFWKRSLPWVISLVLFSWLALGNKAPLNLFGLLEGLPIFSTILRPYKYFAFQIVLSIAVGGGQFFWLLPRLQHKWLEHVCAVALIIGGVGFLYPKTTSLQRQTYTLEVPSEDRIQQKEFHNVQGLYLPRNRAHPPRAVTYLNILRNIGTIDWHTALPMAENAIPKYLVDARNNYIPNALYRGEAFFAEEAGAAGTPQRSISEPAVETGSDEQGPAGYVAEPTFRPNSITVQVTVPEPGILVVNQNYHPAWRTDRGELFDRDGLIALRLRETGSYTVHLRYRPRSFVAGLAISVLSLAGWVLACWMFGPRGGRTAQIAARRDGCPAPSPAPGTSSECREKTLVLQGETPLRGE